MTKSSYENNFNKFDLNAEQGFENLLKTKDSLISLPEHQVSLLSRPRHDTK